ncbi:PrsW family intramembrane metalloprotease [Candidatus Peregrinibacteria bacterium]|nr:PrsW family intramembrane metalloprotease [Candidatus Peregrinibacteria bacterium]
MDLSTPIIATLLALLPALGWMVFYYRKDYRDPEPMSVLFRTFLAGCVVAIPFLVLKIFLSHIPNLGMAFKGFTAVLLFAALEEMAKLVASIFVVTRHRLDFNQVIDGVVYAVTAAIGFAFVENLYYFIQFLNSGSEDLLTVFVFRSFGTMVAHTLFSGIAGLIWAYAYFSKQISPFSQKHLLAFELKDFLNREMLSLHILRKNVLRGKPSQRGGHEKKTLVLEGMVAAILLHALFNVSTALKLFGQNLTFLLVPALMAGLFWISYMFTKKMNIQILKVV